MHPRDAAGRAFTSRGEPPQTTPPKPRYYSRYIHEDRDAQQKRQHIMETLAIEIPIESVATSMIRGHQQKEELLLDGRRV